MYQVRLVADAVAVGVCTVIVVPVIADSAVVPGFRSGIISKNHDGGGVDEEVVFVEEVVCCVFGAAVGSADADYICDRVSVEDIVEAHKRDGSADVVSANRVLRVVVVPADATVSQRVPSNNRSCGVVFKLDSWPCVSADGVAVDHVV